MCRSDEARSHGVVQGAWSYTNPARLIADEFGFSEVQTARARSLGVGTDRWVFPWAGGHANDTASISNRRDLHSSPAIKAIGETVFSHCGINADDIAHVDLYSCFPSAVQIAADASTCRLSANSPSPVG